MGAFVVRFEAGVDENGRRQRLVAPSILSPSDDLFDQVREYPLDRLMPTGWRRQFEPPVETVFRKWYDARFRGWVRVAALLLGIFWTLRLFFTAQSGQLWLICGVALVAGTGWAAWALLGFTRASLSAAHLTVVPGTVGVCLTVYGLATSQTSGHDFTRMAMAVFQLALSVPLGFRLPFRWCVLLLPICLSALVAAIAVVQGQLDQRLLTQWLSALVFSLTVAFLLESDSRVDFGNRATIHRLATTDALSGALRRASFLSLAEKALAEHTASLIMLDLDHFKALNDQYGHRAGDAAIAALGEWVRAELPARSLFVRLGGEEFAVLVPNTPLDQATELARRLRAKLEAARLTEGPNTFGVTGSFGVAQGAHLATLMERADRALYRAKRARNCVEVAGPTEPTPSGV